MKEIERYKYHYKPRGSKSWPVPDNMWLPGPATWEEDPEYFEHLAQAEGRDDEGN